MKRVAWPAIVVGAVALAISAATPSLATTGITAETETPIVVEFSSPWLLELRVTATGDYLAPPDESSGTVAVFFDQLPGTFLDGLVVQPDGKVFVSPPPDQPWLAPGDYNLRAVFTPAPGTGLDSAQVLVANAITILPLELLATVDVQTDPSAITVPTVTISLSNAGGRELASVPPGVWSLSVRDASSDAVVVTRELAQSSALDPLVVELGDSLRAGRDYVLTTSFTPVAEYAPGVTITGTGEQSFTTAAQGPGEFLISPITLPVWVVILIGLGLLLALVGLTVALLVRARRRRNVADSHRDDNSTDPDSAQPADADTVSVDEEPTTESSDVDESAPDDPEPVGEDNEKS